MTEGLKKKWIAALRSKKYKQGDGKLFRAKENEYCCLGVLHRVAKVAIPFDACYLSRSLEHSICESVQTELGNLNDHEGLNFAQIAHWLSKRSAKFLTTGKGDR